MTTMNLSDDLVQSKYVKKLNGQNNNVVDWRALKALQSDTAVQEDILQAYASR